MLQPGGVRVGPGLRGRGASHSVHGSPSGSPARPPACPPARPLRSKMAARGSARFLTRPRAPGLRHVLDKPPHGVHPNLPLPRDRRAQPASLGLGGPRRGRRGRGRRYPSRRRHCARAASTPGRDRTLRGGIGGGEGGAWGRDILTSNQSFSWLLVFGTTARL